jgi:excisionase family DNA binding protein
MTDDTLAYSVPRDRCRGARCACAPTPGGSEASAMQSSRRGSPGPFTGHFWCLSVCRTRPFHELLGGSHDRKDQERSRWSREDIGMSVDLSPGDAARQTGVSRTLIYREIERGYLRAYRVGGGCGSLRKHWLSGSGCMRSYPARSRLPTSRDPQPRAQQVNQLASQPSYARFERGRQRERPEGRALAGQLAR